jgi:hypothetical protein
MSTKSLNDPTRIKCNETKLPLFQAIKAFQPLVVYYLKTMYFNPIFGSGADKVALVDTKDFGLKYQEIDEFSKDTFLTSEGIAKIIHRFWDDHFRNTPVLVKDKSGIEHYLLLVYDDVDKIYHIRDLNNFINLMGDKYDPTKLHPLTYLEMMYTTTYQATIDKHELTTRYPAVGLGSTFPAKVHLMSTNPGRPIEFTSIYNSDIGVFMPEYPILGKGYIDSLVIHPTYDEGLGADYDGDTSNATGVLSAEANAENKEYLDSIKSVIQPNGKLVFGWTDTVNLTVFNMTRDPK